MKSIYDEDYIEIITRLRIIRTSKNITQLDLANKMGKTQSFVSKIESCERRLDVIEFLRWLDTLNENKLIMGFMHKDEYEDFIIHQKATVFSAEEISEMKQNLSPLIGAQFNVLSIPKEILKAFEPSQIGTIVGSLMDACIPQLSILTDSDMFNSVGLTKNEGILGDREGYPDYIHTSGTRLELNSYS